jgi:hypothetical protein
VAWSWLPPARSLWLVLLANCRVGEPVLAGTAATRRASHSTCTACSPAARRTSGVCPLALLFERRAVTNDVGTTPAPRLSRDAAPGRKGCWVGRDRASLPNSVPSRHVSRPFRRRTSSPPVNRSLSLPREGGHPVWREVSAGWVTDWSVPMSGL